MAICYYRPPDGLVQTIVRGTNYYGSMTRLCYTAGVKRKPLPSHQVRLERIVGGGQTIGSLPDGKRVFVWGGLPGETVQVQLTKNKSSMAEGVVTEVLEASSGRQEPLDPQSFLSTSPWQIMGFADEQQAKGQLIQEAFALHHTALPGVVEVYSDSNQTAYRNKVEFSWWWDTDENRLDLAFFRRGTHGKVPVDGTSLARPEINRLAVAVRDLLRSKPVEARSLKALLIRCDRDGSCVWQLYVKDKLPDVISPAEAAALPAQGGEIIYSDPRSPASRITERLTAFGDIVLADNILGVQFRYATEGFFQVNLPVYEEALRDMQRWIADDQPLIDMYSGVGSIGLSIGTAGDGSRQLTLVEIDEHAYREMERNAALIADTSTAVIKPVLAAAEQALEQISGDATVIVDPPRAGLHHSVTERLLEARPERIIYLSCNPVTQARDAELLAAGYDIEFHRGYNFFPRTPHIEHLIVLRAR